MRPTVGAALVALTLVGCDGADDRPPERAPWRMHAIDDRFRGANALGAGAGAGDVNGLADYVTNYEFDQRYVVAVHPGRGDESRRWPTVALLPATPPRGIDTESAALADLDGDGNTDIAGAQGSGEVVLLDGDEPGVRVILGPPAERDLGAARRACSGCRGMAGRWPCPVHRGGRPLALGAGARRRPGRRHRSPPRRAPTRPR